MKLREIIELEGNIRIKKRNKVEKVTVGNWPRIRQITGQVVTT
jgi:hypothetical protein